MIDRCRRGGKAVSPLRQARVAVLLSLIEREQRVYLGDGFFELAREVAAPSHEDRDGVGDVGTVARQ
jgi:hypothetical protein